MLWLDTVMSSTHRKNFKMIKPYSQLKLPGTANRVKETAPTRDAACSVLGSKNLKITLCRIQV